MNIGEKIKLIRTSKCITQKQLAGEYITRNMLSRIENGIAVPSVQTMLYLADKLNVPVGFLLAEENEEPVYRKIYSIDNIKRAFIDGNFRICRDICMSVDIDDDEINLILSKCNLEIAKEEFNSGKLKSAGKYFEEAIDYSDRTVYSNGVVYAIASVYYRYMRRISPTLGGDIECKANEEVLAYSDKFCTYVVELENLDETSDKNINISETDDAYSDEDPLKDHILALKYMKKSNYKMAFEILNKILKSQMFVSDPVLCDVFGHLEICAKEIEDYKSAYEYAAGRMNLLERMLSEADI